MGVGGWGGWRSIGEREWRTEAWRGELLKKACQNNENKWRHALLRWRGELHLRGVFGGAFCWVQETEGVSVADAADAELRRRKMRVLIVIIVQGQLFPRRSKSHGYVLAWKWSCCIQLLHSAAASVDDPQRSPVQQAAVCMDM